MYLAIKKLKHKSGESKDQVLFARLTLLHVLFRLPYFCFCYTGDRNKTTLAGAYNV